MFLCKNRKRSDGEIDESRTLCEAMRTERGPRQRVVDSLGKFTDEDLAARWEDLEALLVGRQPKVQRFRTCAKCRGENHLKIFVSACKSTERFS